MPGRLRSAKPPNPLCSPLGSPPGSLGKWRLAGRAGGGRLRPLQIHRWRRHLETAHHRPAVGSTGPRTHRHRHRGIQSKNPETVYVANTGTYISTDGGKTFTAFKGAPGGDDYHRIWINPDQPDIMLFAADQGAVVTVNGGETWSSWYNQPTAQFYHVITDNQFPYWVYGGQQESGSAGVASRGDYGGVTWRDWRTIGVDEYGYVAPDPLDPNIIYGGRVTRFDKRTGQVQNVGPAR